MANLGFGLDIGGVMDIDPGLTPVAGRRALAESVARRLTTPAGSLWYDPNYGHDLRAYLNAPVPRVGFLESQVAAEVLKDERVFDVDVRVVFADTTLRTVLRLQTDTGPFEFVLEVSQVTVKLLEVV